MRLSVDPADPGFAPLQAISLKKRKLISVRLDGQLLPNNVIICDDETGFVRLQRLDHRGRPLQDPTNPKRVWTEDRRGYVQIYIPADEPLDLQVSRTKAATEKRARRAARNLRLVSP